MKKNENFQAATGNLSLTITTFEHSNSTTTEQGAQ